MKLFKCIVTLCLFYNYSIQSQEYKYQNDTKSVQNILDAYYDCISGPIGEKRDFARLKNLFHPSANFIYTFWNNEETKASAMVFNTIDEYLEKLDYMDKKGFYEHEISNIINQFSTVIQVFSTYTFRVQDKSIEPKRGITSYEIFYDGERYWIMSMFWNIESKKHQIPEEYLEVRNQNKEDSLKNIISILDQALINRDYNILDKYYSNNMKLIAPNGFVLTKEMALAPFKDPNKKSSLNKVSNEDIQITIHNNVATVLMKTIHSFNNNSNDKFYKNIQLFVKINNIWKLELSSSVALKN